MVQRDGVSETVAARRIKEIGADISAFIRHHFQQDAAEPHNFDIVINTGSLNVASATIWWSRRTKLVSVKPWRPWRHPHRKVIESEGP